jgi:hypothetical protein
LLAACGHFAVEHLDFVLDFDGLQVLRHVGCVVSNPIYLLGEN